jgi:hypothetical protein
VRDVLVAGEEALSKWALASCRSFPHARALAIPLSAHRPAPTLPLLHIFPVAVPPIPEEHRLPLLQGQLMAADKGMEGVL